LSFDLLLHRYAPTVHLVLLPPMRRRYRSLRTTLRMSPKSEPGWLRQVAPARCVQAVGAWAPPACRSAVRWAMQI
jgi:hypothetical protein